MIFRQLFDAESSSYTYLLAEQRDGEAILIDPIDKKVPEYLRLLRELDLKLVMAVDTHLHADHASGAPRLGDSTGCMYAMGGQSRAKSVTHHFKDNDALVIGRLVLRALHTPGHTEDSYCFVMNDRVLTGDTLLIRGTGRSDLQSGDPGALYDSISQRLLTLPGDTLVFPAHDYAGRTSSTIIEEKLYNQRLQVNTRDEFIEQMNKLQLDQPGSIDTALADNIQAGLKQAA